MTDLISDSETEELIPISSISADKVQKYLQQLNDDLKRQVSAKIEEKYRDVQVPKGDTENQDIERALLLMANNQAQTSRRGLRKRNFSSTHPYLADQAHWLGLASADYLNDIYEQNHDLETMLRLLNQQYLRNKQKYPNEERYKLKSFFKFLGVSHPNNDPHQNPHNTNQLSQYEAEGDDLRIGEPVYGPTNEQSDYGSDDSLVETHKPMFISDSDDSLVDVARQPLPPIQVQSDSEGTEEDSSDSEAYVRVGGRVRKEKSVLRGVLPESARRLDIYTTKKPHTTKRRLEPEKRKGLAVKKKLSHKTRFLNEGDLYNELFTNESDTSDHYIPFNEPVNVNEALTESSLFDSKYGAYFSDISDSEVEERDDFDMFELRKEPPIESSRDMTDVYDIAEDLPRQEGQQYPRMYDQKEINPDIVRSPRTKGATPKSSSKRKKTGTRSLGPRKMLKRKVFDKSGAQKLTRPRSIYKSGSSRSESTKSANSKSRSTSYRSGVLIHTTQEGDTAVVTEPTTIPQPPLKPSVSKETVKPHTLDPRHFYFHRNPVLSTTVFEAESDKKFVNFNRYNNLTRTPRDVQRSSMIDIDVSRLHNLSEGFYLFNLPPIISDLSFDTVNKPQSTKNSQTTLLKIAKFMNDDEFQGALSHISQSIKALIIWHLTVQESPSDMEWKYLRISLSTLVKRNIPRLGALAPYFLCLFFIFWKLEERYSFSRNTTVETEFLQFCGYYWKLLFARLGRELDEVVLIDTEDDFMFITQLLSYKKSLIWDSVATGVKDVDSTTFEPSEWLDGIFFVANKLDSKHYNWKCFYQLYERATLSSAQSSTFHKDFLDVCFLLNQRKSWPLEEKLIMKVYGTITKNKFFNFSDEGTKVTTMGRIYTFNDIPNSTFFERFMQLVYYFASSLDKPSSMKRLANKLLISSSYEYELSKESLAAYVNRFNFVILLSQVSDLNQTQLVTNLTKLIIDCGNVNVYQMTIRLLKGYSETMAAKISMVPGKRSSGHIPVTSFTLLLEKISQLTYTLTGSTHVLMELTSAVRKIFLVPGNGWQFFEMFNALDLRKFYDSISSKLIDLCLNVAEMVSLDFPEQLLHVEQLLRVEQLGCMEQTITKVTSFLNHQMGRFPMQNRVQEMRSVKVIEDSIKIWIKLSKTINANWNKILLQDFPYMGNSYLRDIFVLFLVNRILEFDFLDHHRETIIETILKQVSKLNPSAYVNETINSLRKYLYNMVNFKNQALNRNLSEIEVSTNKFQIVSSILTNVVDDPRMLEDTKLVILTNYVEFLNDEYDKYFMSPRFVDSCKRIIELLQSISQLSKDLEVFRELVNKLGITPVSSAHLMWKNMSEIDQLSMLHKNLVSSIIYKKDVVQTLKEFTGTSFHLIYHLMSIYLKGIIQNQPELWMLLCHLMDFLIGEMEKFKVDITDRDFGRILLMMTDMTSVYNSRSVSRFGNVLRNYQLKTMILTCKLLQVSFIAFDGYKDQSIILEIIQRQVIDYQLPNFQKLHELSRPFSHYIYYDISTTSKELSQLMEDGLNLPELEKYNPEHQFSQLNLIVNSLEFESETLPFDF